MPKGKSSTRPENSPHPPTPSPNLGRGGANETHAQKPARIGIRLWLPPLPMLGEGGWGGEGQIRCATFSDWRNNTQYAILRQAQEQRNTQYAIRNTQYAIRKM